MAGALTGGFLQIRSGLKPAFRSAVFGGVLLVRAPGAGALGGGGGEWVGGSPPAQTEAKVRWRCRCGVSSALNASAPRTRTSRAVPKEAPTSTSGPSAPCGFLNPLPRISCGSATHTHDRARVSPPHRQAVIEGLGITLSKMMAAPPPGAPMQQPPGMPPGAPGVPPPLPPSLGPEAVLSPAAAPGGELAGAGIGGGAAPGGGDAGSSGGGGGFWSWLSGGEDKVTEAGVSAVLLHGWGRAKCKARSCPTYQPCRMLQPPLQLAGAVTCDLPPLARVCSPLSPSPSPDLFTQTTCAALRARWPHPAAASRTRSRTTSLPRRRCRRASRAIEAAGLGGRHCQWQLRGPIVVRHFLVGVQSAPQRPHLRNE
jgi:hypothetical protein